jgi:hypothetical protein
MAGRSGATARGGVMVAKVPREGGTPYLLRPLPFFATMLEEEGARVTLCSNWGERALACIRRP